MKRTLIALVLGAVLTPAAAFGQKISLSSDGTLTVVGTDRDEVIEIFVEVVRSRDRTPIATVFARVSHDELILTRSAPVDYVDRIVVLARGGDDDVYNETHLPSDIDGGDGHDSLHGGIGDDILRGGKGLNGLYGNFGADILIAGSDSENIMYGGAGLDTFIYLPWDQLTDGLYNNDQVDIGGWRGWQYGWQLIPDIPPGYFGPAAVIFE